MHELHLHEWVDSHVYCNIEDSPPEGGECLCRGLRNVGVLLLLLNIPFKLFVLQSRTKRSCGQELNKANVLVERRGLNNTVFPLVGSQTLLVSHSVLIREGELAVLTDNHHKSSRHIYPPGAEICDKPVQMIKCQQPQRCNGDILTTELPREYFYGQEVGDNCHHGH